MKKEKNIAETKKRKWAKLKLLMLDAWKWLKLMPRCLWNWITSKQGILTLAVIALLIAFRPWLEELFLKYPIEYLLKNLEPSTTIDISFLIVTIVALLGLGKLVFYSGFKFSTSHKLEGFALGLILGGYRFLGNDHFDFIYFENSNWLVYSDVLIILSFSIPVLPFLLWVFSKKKKVNNGAKTESGFVGDGPIKSTDDESKDSMKRFSFAKKIVEKLLNTHVNGAFNIGINGSWGSGKTSFLSLIKKALGGKAIIIDYNPWEAHDSKSLIMHFFTELRLELSKHHSGIGGPMSSYAKALTNIDDNLFSKGIQKVSELFGEENSIGDEFEKINKILESIGKKVIIFIDDLDRLSGEEILEVLKLIRNTADFNQTHYIVAFDRQYIVDQLKDESSALTSDFLEKFFQFEFSFPPMRALLVKNYFLSKVKLISPEGEEIIKRLILEDPLGVQNYFRNIGLSTQKPVDFFSELISDFRKANRLFNSFLIDFSLVKGEVSERDQFILCVLKVSYPKVHQLIFSKKSKYFKETNSPHGKIYNFRSKKASRIHSSANPPPNNEQSQHSEIIFNDLQNNHNSFGFEKREFPIVKLLLELLFMPENPNTLHYYSLRRVPFFHRYFYLDLFSNDFSENKFIMAISDGEVSFSSFLSECHEKGLLKQLGERILLIDNPSKRSFELVWKSIFDFLDSSLFGDELSAMAYVFTRFLHKHGSSLIGTYGTVEKLGDFIFKELLENGTSPYLFKSRANWVIIDELTLSIEGKDRVYDKERLEFFGLNQESIESLNSSYLEAFLTEKEKWADEFKILADSNVFKKSSGRNWVGGSEKVLQEWIIKNDPIGFVEDCGFYSEHGNKVYVGKYMKLIFDHPKNFSVFFPSDSSDSKIIETIDICSLFSPDSLERSVNIELKYLKLHNLYEE